MRRLTIAATLLLLCTALPISLTATKGEAEGKAWLDAQKDPAALNVNGTWDSEEWGTFHLVQATGSREVSGNGGGYEIAGIVSGKRLFMLISSRRSVDYCAIMSPNGENSLIGTYSSRKSLARSGACQEKSRPMNMTKK
ncbi:MAG: hypothetical protein WB729_17025 [Candidatus Sulfotelmatobacter sp.]